MTRARFDLDHPRFPVWEYPDLLESAAAVDHCLDVSNEAIRPTAGDPVAAFSHTNYHTLILGPPRLLHDTADELVGQIRERFAFGRDSPWFDRRGAIAGLIRSYYRDGGTGLGTFSVLPMRRPAQFRSEQERGIEVATAPGSPSFRFLSRKIESRWDPKIPLGGWARRFDLPIAGLPFACSAGSRAADNRLAKVLVRRHIRAPLFNLRPDQEYYGETWLCQACLGGDEARLSRGHIPAVPLKSYQGNAVRVRTSPILNLVKIDIGRLLYQVLAVEIDAAAGGLFLSIRHGSMPLSVAVLNASPVEHVGVCQALRKLAR